MALYSFEDMETGEVTEMDFPMSDAPRWGECVVVDGRTYRRQFELPTKVRVKGSKLRKAVDCPRFKGFASMSQAPVFDKAQQREHVHAGRCSGFDENQRPTFETKAQAKRWADNSGGAVKWDT